MRREMLISAPPSLGSFPAHSWGHFQDASSSLMTGMSNVLRGEKVRTIGLCNVDLS